MRVVSHTCSNTEIVCALGAAGTLVGVDADSDFPEDAVAALPKLGRDLEFDVEGTAALKPDLVLTSLTVPGHERIVGQLQDAGLRTLVCDPLSLEDVYDDIARIAGALGVPARGADLIADMRAAMPAADAASARPRVLIEWWPKPVIAPARQSWATDVLVLAGGRNPWAGRDAKSVVLSDADVLAAAPEAVVMSWCGVSAEKYRAEVVRRRPGWAEVPAVVADRIAAVSEACLGRPGPRLVEGYRALRALIETLQ
jgi:iron complex transport system substrate-binding protein